VEHAASFVAFGGQLYALYASAEGTSLTAAVAQSNILLSGAGITFLTYLPANGKDNTRWYRGKVKVKVNADLYSALS